MLPIDRATVIGGPCLLTYNGVTIYTAGDVTINPKKALFDIPSLRYGKKTSQNLKDFYFTVSFTPSGEVTNALLGLYYALYALTPGLSLFPSSDQALVIIGVEATWNRVTFRNSALTKIPDGAVKPSATAFGAVEFTCLGGKGIAFNDPDRIVLVDTFAYPADTFDSTTIITAPSTASWANANSIPSGFIVATTDASPDVITTSNTLGGAAHAHGLVVNDQVLIAGTGGDTAINGAVFVKTVPTPSTLTLSATKGGAAIAGAGAYTSGGTFLRANPFDEFDTETGFDITHALETKVYGTTSTGAYDVRMVSLDVMAKATPVGPGTSDLITALNPQGTNAAIGKSMTSEGQDLFINGAGIYWKLTRAALRNGPPVWSLDKTRIGVLEWGANRVISGGVALPLAEVSTAPITS